MNSNTFSENKLVAALLTVTPAKSRPCASSERILGDYRKFLSELSPEQPVTLYELDKPGRKTRFTIKPSMKAPLGAVCAYLLSSTRGGFCQ